MPRQLSARERAKALQSWWAAFPYGGMAQRLEAIHQFEQQHGPLTEEEKRAAYHRLSPQLKARLGTSKVFTAPTDIGEKEALKLCEQLLEDSHYDLLLNETGLVETPAYEPLCILLKNVIPQSLLDDMRPVLRKAAAQRKIAGGRRGTAAGAGTVKRKRRDGSVSNMSGSPRLDDLSDDHFARLKAAKDGIVGYLDRAIGGGQVYPCRLTHYSGALPQELALMEHLAGAVAESFKQSWLHDRWEAQFAKAGETPSIWLLQTNEGITPFTTITCNMSWRTAAHVDKGDLKEGFGVMCCLGDFEGCDLVFPRYRTAVRYREGDVILADVHQVHGNTPLLNPDGTVPTDRQPERLVCVFYYREHMDQCESTKAKEENFINRRERGDAIRKKKAKAKGAGR
jgi:hypothetical protein